LAGAITSGINGFNVIEGGVRLRGVKMGVLMAGELRCRGGIPMLEVGQHGVAGGGGATGIGRRWMGMKELTGGAHTLVRGERESAEDGRCNPKKKTHSAEYAKGVRGPDRPSSVVVSCGVMGRLGRIPGGIQRRE
jgi:hypothetical protein